MSGLGVSPDFDAEGFPVCSPGLRKLLTEGESTYGAARLIAINATLRKDCEAVLPVLERATDHASATDLYELLDQMAPLFGVPVPQEPGELWRVYVVQLAEMPLSAIRAAFTVWRSPTHHAKHPGMAAIFPTAAQLHGPALAHRNTLAQMRYRARKAMEMAERDAAAPKPSADERKQIAEGLRAVLGEMSAKRMPGPGYPQRSPQEVAQQLRARAQQKAEEDPGDVI